MTVRRLMSIILTFTLLGTFAFSQSYPAPADPEKEKRKKQVDEKVVQMIEQAIADAQALRLPQNRAIVFALAGDLFWKFDEKRSRELFRNAANEIIAYNIESERERQENTETSPVEFYDPSDTRYQVMPLIGKNDPEFALELLVQTRPADLVEAIQKSYLPDPTDGNVVGFSPIQQRVRQEIDMEQRFALIAANENPDKAIKLIKESLANGVSANVLQLLQKLHSKDEKKAGELGSEVIRKIVDTDLARKNSELQVALSFLQFAARPVPTNPKDKQFRFSETQARELAAKLVNTFLQPGTSTSVSMSLARAMPNLEKLVPEKVALLKQRLASNQKAMSAELKNAQRMQALWGPNVTPESILAEIPKLQNQSEKMAAYNALANRISGVEDEARAKRLIEQIGDVRMRERAIEQFESARISRLVSAGRLDEARRLIGGLTSRKSQIQKMVALAVQFHAKRTEADVESAKDLLKAATSLTSQFPEDEDELADLMELVKGYAIVEPDVAFRLFEPVIDQMNDFVMASAILSKYNKRNRSFKKGELLMRTNGNTPDALLLFRYVNQMQMLGKADLDRMSLLTDRFLRSDTRTIVKLLVIQGFMTNDRRPGQAFQPVGF